MALPSSGSLSFSQINVELGRSATAQLSMNDSGVRGLFGVASGRIGMNDGRGKSSAFVFNQTIATNTANYDLRAAAVSAGWNQTTPLNATVTINSGVYVYSGSTGSYAFVTGTTFPAGSVLSLINNGTIVGRGGDGGTGGNASTGFGGGGGGPALYAGYALRVTNNGRIAGGGGGGGGGGS